MTKGVIFILSSPRSGSTLLDKAIGAHPACFSLGEIVNFAEEFQKEKTLCGCGDWLNQCAFWAQVNDYFRQHRGIDFKANPGMNDIQFRFPGGKRASQVYTLLGLLGIYPRQMKEVLDRTASLFDAVVEVSGRRLLVDSSKNVSRAFVLGAYLRKKGYEPFFIHLVRKPEGVVNSQLKPSYQAVVVNEDGEQEMKTFAAGEKSYDFNDHLEAWIRYNKKALNFLRWLPGKNRMIIGHEAFISDPGLVLEQLCERMGLAFDSRMNTLDNDHNHILGGNASRVNANAILPQQSNLKNLTAEQLGQIAARTRDLVQRIETLRKSLP